MEGRHILQSAEGTSLLEMVVVAGLVSLLSVVSVPLLAQAVADSRAHSAARYLATCVQGARLEAARRGAQVAIRFESHEGGHRFTTYVDGNGDGVRTADITRGIDVATGASVALGDHFGDVDLRIAFAMPGIDGEPPSRAEAIPSGWDPERCSRGARWDRPRVARSTWLALAGRGSAVRASVDRSGQGTPVRPGAGQWRRTDSDGRGPPDRRAA